MNAKGLGLVSSGWPRRSYVFGYMLFSRSDVWFENRDMMRELCSRSPSAKLRRLLDELSLEPSSCARLRLFVLAVSAARKIGGPKSFGLAL